jgi:DNA-binding FadR family transcriptional regulator
VATPSSERPLAVVPSAQGLDAPAVGRHVRVPKTAELVARQLRRQIVRGDLQAGDSLPSEANLMTQFGVSRPTLREAFRVLESESLISVRRGAHGGARVHSPDGQVAARNAALVLEYRGTTLADLYQARNVIEPPCVGMLARRRTALDLERLRTSLAQENQLDEAASIKGHMRFHRELVELAGNQTLIVLSDMIRHILDLATESHVVADAGSPANRRAFAKGHRAHVLLVDHIEAQDEAAAVALWSRHLSEAEDYLLDVPGGVKTVLDLLG